MATDRQIKPKSKNKSIDSPETIVEIEEKKHTQGKHLQPKILQTKFDKPIIIENSFACFSAIVGAADIAPNK